MTTTKTGGTVYQVVRSLDKNGWFVNANRWDSDRGCYTGNNRDTDAKFSTRSAAEEYVAEQEAR